MSVEWVGGIDGFARLIDQTRLPGRLMFVDCETVATVWEAIRSLRVRGAPAIGVAAAMGMVLASRDAKTRGALAKQMREASVHLRTSRPTAVNLFWVLDRMDRVKPGEVRDWRDRLLAEALAIQAEDAAMCHAMGAIGAELISSGDGILTHCNTGGLATAEYGTALAAIFTAADQGKSIRVFADETRPLLQGARLTTWELQRRGIPVTLICDNMAGQVMKEGRIQRVFVGADRIAANGDAANKIGTYSVAVLARHHHIPFYVVAPSTTFDLTLADGRGIPIEERPSREITHAFGKPTAPRGTVVYNPAFDVTPASLISGIVTEKGLVEPVSTERIREIVGK